jgi:hypothetical protein
MVFPLKVCLKAASERPSAQAVPDIATIWITGPFKIAARRQTMDRDQEVYWQHIGEGNSSTKTLSNTIGLGPRS